MYFLSTVFQTYFAKFLKTAIISYHYHVDFIKLREIYTIFTVYKFFISSAYILIDSFIFSTLQCSSLI